MADVQTENGFTQIANELLEALAKIRIPGEARQVLDVIFRKTYGFKKTSDRISLSQFCLATGINKPNICAALSTLKRINIIAQKDNTLGNIYKINKDFDTWQPLPKKITLPKKIIPVAQKDNLPLPKKIPTKETITKETITKETKAPVVIPDFITPEIWTAYLEMRKSIRKPLKTEHQYNLAISTLTKLQSQGHNPNDILNQSILNSWQGLFAVKINRHEETDEERMNRISKL